MNYIMLFISVLFLAFNFADTKLYQKREGVAPVAGFRFNAFVGFFTAVLFLVANGFKLSVTGYSLLMATLINSLVMIYTVIGFKIMESGSMARYMMFLMSGGMAVPYIWGLLFLDEEFSWLRTVGLIIIFLGIIFSNFSKEKSDLKQILLCVAVFFLNGFVSVFSKLHQISTTFKAVSTNDFVILGGIIKFIIAAAVCFILSKKSVTAKEENNEKTPIKTIIMITAGSAILSGSSYFIQLWAASSLPSTVLYPFITGGSIVLTSLAGCIFFKDKLSKLTVLGIISCFVGTLLFL